jgi:hypothetical protein
MHLNNNTVIASRLGPLIELVNGRRVYIGPGCYVTEDVC